MIGIPAGINAWLPEGAVAEGFGFGPVIDESLSGGTLGTQADMRSTSAHVVRTGVEARVGRKRAPEARIDSGCRARGLTRVPLAWPTAGRAALARLRRALLVPVLLGYVGAGPLQAQSTGSISGVVTDIAGGRPLAGAQVLIEALDLDAVTDAAGRYAIQGVPAGRHRVTTGMLGYLAAGREVVVIAGEVAVLDLGLRFTALDLEELVVTGTSAETAARDLPYAVSVASRRNLAEQGSPMAVELFKALGVSHGVVGERQSWFNAQEAAAVPETVANVNLRGLGASRTLVLLNGRRQVYLPARLIGGRYVDLNAFPSIALDRIEVLKEGASAIYGSDAVAGVANFRTRGDFSGTEVTATHEHFAGAGDSEIAAIVGRSFGGRAHGVLSVEWVHRQELPSVERDWALHPYIPGAGAWSWTGNPGAFLMPTLTGGESNQEFVAKLSQAHFSDGGVFVDPGCTDFGGHREPFTCRFRYQPWDNLLERSTHVRAFAEVNGELGDDTRYHIEGLWAEAETPEWVTTPSFPPIKPYDGLQLVAPEHPGRQEFCNRQAASAGFATSALCLEDDWFFFGRLVGNSGPGRRLRRESGTQRLSASMDVGLNIVRGHENRLNLALDHSRSSGNVNQPAEYAYRKFLAYRGYGGPDCGVGVVADGSSPSGMALGEVGGKRPGQGACMYYNPFSNGLDVSRQPGSRFFNQPNPGFVPALANDPSLLDWINEEVDVLSVAGLWVADARISGSAELARNYSLGYQFRRLDVSASVNDAGNLDLNPCAVLGSRDCLERAGSFTFTTGSYPYAANQTVHRVFGEVPLHLWDGRLRAQLAANYESYSVAGSFNPKVALRFDISDRITLRGSVQTTFRAPSVDDLNEDRTTSLLYVNEAGIYKAVDTYGARDLKPEQAFTYNAGVVLSLPDETGFVPVQLQADYWSYDFRDVIAVVPHSAITALYHQGGRSRDAVKELVTCSDGRGTGTCSVTGIERIHVDLINWPGVATSGVDLQLDMRARAGVGILNTGLQATYTRNFSIEALSLQGVEIAPAAEAAGRLNKYNPIAPPLPRLKGRLFGSYGWSDYSVVGYANYISSYVDADEADSEYEDIEALVTLDVTALWRPASGVGASLSLLNLTDAAPPFVKWEQSFDGFTHSAKGRRIKLSLVYRLR